MPPPGFKVIPIMRERRKRLALRLAQPEFPQSTVVMIAGIKLSRTAIVCAYRHSRSIDRKFRWRVRVGILGWVVWGLSCLVMLANIGVSLSSRDASARWLAGRYAFLVGLGLTITAAPEISKLHLLWWLPAAFAINMVAAGASVERATRRWFKQHPPTSSDKPVGLWMLVSLATGTAILDVLNLRTGRRIFAKAEGDAFAKVYQSILLYLGVLVDIYVDDLVKERKMRLVGIPWDEFDAKREILTGIAYALARRSEDDEVPEDDELCVTSDTYQAYLKSFLRLTLVEYENAISEVSHGDGCRPVDQYAIAAGQFIESVTSIEGFGKDVRDVHLIATINRFAEEARICVRRSCHKHVRGCAITNSWD